MYVFEFYRAQLATACADSVSAASGWRRRFKHAANMETGAPNATEFPAHIFAHTWADTTRLGG
jgi:hypothetical protein